MYRIRTCVLAALGLLAAGFPGAAVPARPVEKPNVVYLLADDLGWGDLGTNGGGIPSPRIDRPFAQVVRLDTFMGWCVCSPTAFNVCEPARVSNTLRGVVRRFLHATTW